MLTFTSGITKNGTWELFLDGFEHWEDFDRVLDELIMMGCQLTHRGEDVFARTARLVYDQQIFELIFHEDVGLYVCGLPPRTEAADQQLHGLVEGAMQAAQQR